MILRLIPILFILMNLSFSLSAQDTLTLMSGKSLVVKNVGLSGYSVSYRTTKAKSKLKSINIDKVFSIKYANGTERIIYLPDSLETDEYSVSEMRMFIKGEQDAIKYFKNDLNKVGAFLFGAGSAYFSFYGIVGPAVYSTLVGSFSPDVRKQKTSDPALMEVVEYRDGYALKMRNIKTKNSLIYGLAGFATGIITYSIIGNNN